MLNPQEPILAAVEANEESRHIVARARQLAGALSKSLHLMNAIPSLNNPDTNPYYPITFEYVDQAREMHHAENREHLLRLLGNSSCAEQHVRVLEDDPVRCIVDSAEQINAGLLIMGLHNRHGFSRLLGSVTHGVLNHSKKSLLAVHPDSSAAAYRRVLIALDISQQQPDIIESAKPIIDAAEATEILAVTEPLSRALPVPEAFAVAADLSTEMQSAAKAEATQRANAAGLSSEQVKVTEGDPRAEILHAAEAMQADLIVMGTHNRGPVARLLLGSTTHGVLNHAPCDVLVINAADDQTAD